MIEFVFPQSTGEWLAWFGAFYFIIGGLVALITPRRFMTLTHLAVEKPAGMSEIRGALGGAYIGFGVAAIMFAQPLIYLALGFALAGMVLGRLISMAIDGARSSKVWFFTAIEALLAFFPIAYVFGLIA
ncbi:MAG: DUF4345 domain-containing protein [Hyphomicrobiales bacterium]|nr:MAG: DUF4345 domain-containing protein [Hyphomicrobiales bacterium]